MRRWSKIFTLGDPYTKDIFSGPVSVTEKVDGSQINFGYNSKDGLWILSKGSSVHLGDGNKLFNPVAQSINDMYAKGVLKEGWSYHGETLANPKHNTLAYSRVPEGHVALYGAFDEQGCQISSHETLLELAKEMGCEVVREIFQGSMDPGQIGDKLEEWLETESQLGKEKIEGVVIKNYAREQFVGGMLLPLTQAKYVSERFKERHKVAWPEANKSPLFLIGEMVRTEARWRKAVQKIEESGEITHTPKDIGLLLKYLHTDLEEEDKEVIKEQYDFSRI